jgi:hypothetical protein
VGTGFEFLPDLGQVTLTWDDERTSRDDLLAAMARGGFRPAEAKLAPRSFVSSRIRAANARVVFVGFLAGAILVPALGHSGVTRRETRIALVPLGVPVQRKASNVECALRTPVQAVFDRLGFAVQVSEDELGRVRTDPEIYLVLADPGSWVARIESHDQAVVEARTKELEAELGFTSDHRYNTPAYGGFAAILGWRQLVRLTDEPDVRVNPDPWVYLVFYEPGVDVDARTDELERRYGFTAIHRYRSLGGFSAQLTKSELGGIATESDIRLIGRDARFSTRPSGARCLRSSPRLRRQLREVFVRAHPELAGRQLRGPLRVRFASETPVGGTKYALASFLHPRRAAATQPESFRLPAESRLRWRPLGPTNGVSCVDQAGHGPIPRDVLRAWLLPGAGTSCYRTR